MHKPAQACSLGLQRPSTRLSGPAMSGPDSRRHHWAEVLTLEKELSCSIRCAHLCFVSKLSLGILSCSTSVESHCCWRFGKPGCAQRSSQKKSSCLLETFLQRVMNSSSPTEMKSFELSKHIHLAKAARAITPLVSPS